MIKETKQQKVYRVLKARIIEHVYAPGQRIVIDQIANELQTSAIPVREAIRQLEAERLIFYKRNIGPVVAEVNETDYSDTLRILAVLESHATALSAKNFPKEKIALLKDQNKSMKEALETFDMMQFSALNATFHRTICEACDNRYLLELIESTWNRMDAIRGAGSTLYSKRVKESINEHEQIIDLLEKGDDLLTLELLTRKHKLRTAEDFERRRLKNNNVTKS